MNNLICIHENKVYFAYLAFISLVQSTCRCEVKQPVALLLLFWHSALASHTNRACTRSCTLSPCVFHSRERCVQGKPRHETHSFLQRTKKSNYIHECISHPRFQLISSFNVCPYVLRIKKKKKAYTM